MGVKRRIAMTVGIAVAITASASSILTPSMAAAVTSAPTTISNQSLPTSSDATIPAGWTSVTLQLTANDPQAVAQLSQAQGLSPQTHRDVLRSAFASPERQSAVATFLTDHGLNCHSQETQRSGTLLGGANPGRTSVTL